MEQRRPLAHLGCQPPPPRERAPGRRDRRRWAKPSTWAGQRAPAPPLTGGAKGSTPPVAACPARGPLKLLGQNRDRAVFFFLFPRFFPTSPPQKSHARPTGRSAWAWAVAGALRRHPSPPPALPPPSRPVRHRPPCGKSPPPPPSASAAMPPPPRPTGPVAAAATPGTVAPPQAAPRHGVGGSAARPLARPRATARQPGARPQGDGGARWEPGKEAIHGGLQLGPRAATQAGAHRRRCGCVLEAGARDDATRAVDLSPCT